ncbi:hypothetical protein [Microcystis sp. M169S2]|uniref:hypothetical protein n=1 Tax=Microcystis sp. M169S2 TaxID=2771157 RepID=UPI002587F0E0|nr:hypothetical protein [Microcystis sp. M169S2]
MGVGVLGFWGFSSISPLPPPQFIIHNSHTPHPTPHTPHPPPHTPHPTPHTPRKTFCRRP